MFAYEKTMNTIIQKISRNNSLGDENEQAYWDRHWRTHKEYIKKNNTPMEINDMWYKNLYDEMLHHYRGATQGFLNKTVCELGCGSGYPTLLMAKEGAKVTLVDFSPASLDYAKDICEYMSIDADSVRFIVEDAFSKDLDIGIYDIVWNCGVVEHYEDSDAVELVKVMSKHAKKGGKVMVTLPNLLSLELIYGMFKVGKGSEIYYTKRKLNRIMENAGLKNVTVKSINYWVPSFLPAAFANDMRKVKFLSGLGWLFNGVGTKV